MARLNSKRFALRPPGLRANVSLCLRQLRAQHLKAAAQQILLAGVVGIESGAADIGLVDDVLDRDRLIAFAHNEGHQRAVKRLLRTLPRGDPLPLPLSNPQFPDRRRRSSNTEHRRFFVH